MGTIPGAITLEDREQQSLLGWKEVIETAAVAIRLALHIRDAGRLVALLAEQLERSRDQPLAGRLVFHGFST
jgi:hypothetical protein